MQKTTKKPPKGLQKPGRAYWHTVIEAFVLDDDGLELLFQSCSMLDRAESAAATIAAEGMVQRDRFGQLKPHPLVEIERQSRLAFARLRRELNLSEPPGNARPPLPPGYR